MQQLESQSYQQVSGSAWAGQDPTTSSTVAQQKQAAGMQDFRTSRETILFVLVSKKAAKIQWETDLS